MAQVNVIDSLQFALIYYAVGSNDGRLYVMLHGSRAGKNPKMPRSTWSRNI